MPERLYLDHAATTPVIDAARRAIADGMARWANPSSPHAEGRAARAALEDARRRIAAAYGWRHETILTSGTSEALAIALNRASVGRRMISAVEHDAVIRAAPDAIVLPVDERGCLSADRVSTALDTNGDGAPERASTSLDTNGEGALERVSTALDTNGEGRATSPIPPAAPFVSSAVETRRPRTLVCVQWANSETGVLQPIAAIAAAVHAAGDLLLVDAAQMPPGADPAIADHADFVALSSHKRGGPVGIGALLVRDLATLAPTGGQERGYRPGTENLPGALGYAAALGEAEPVGEWARLRALLDDAIVRSGGDVAAEGAERHPAIGSYRMRGTGSAAQLIRFDLAGISVSAGSACASGSMKPSHVLAAMGWDEAASREVIRVSFGRSTSEADVTRFIQAWRQTARETRSFAA